MKTTVRQRKAVKACLERHLPFALWALPGEDKARFIASLPDREGNNVWDVDDDAWDGFFINFFGNDETYTAAVRASFDENDLNILDTFDCAGPELQPRDRSMDYYTYLALARGLIKGLGEKEKVVFSRIIALRGSDDVLAVCLRYFKGLPDTLRYLCYTHETGLWLGATPEVLADYSLATHLLKTEALAGTRSASEEGPWDRKNMTEHMIVPASILRDITEMGGSVDSSSLTLGEKRFGDIVHLRTAIEARMPDINVRDMLTSLSPTSAICGYPCGEALKKIIAWETHSRYCYGGFVGVKEGDSLRAYANIRCAFVGDKDADGRRLYNIYAGGGLVKSSKPKNEWLETKAKSQRLVAAVTET